jgi:hypothetical protein
VKIEKDGDGETSLPPIQPHQQMEEHSCGREQVEGEERAAGMEMIPRFEVRK